MKKSILLFSILWLSFTACDTNRIPPKEVGKHVFGILKTLDTLDTETFRSHFMTFDEVLKVMNIVNVNEEFHEKAANMTTDLYNADIDNIYHYIKQEAVDNYIYWKNIEYIAYEYESYINNSVTSLIGTLYFKKENEIFRMQILSIEQNNTFDLISLGRPVREEERIFE